MYSQDIRRVTGVVIDEKGEPLPGAAIIIEGSPKGVMTDVDGYYSIDVLPTDKITATFIGYSSLTIAITAGKDKYDFQLFPVENELDDAMVVAFGKQKKESIVSSLSTISPGDLKSPSSNMTNILGGRIAGVISRQTSGEPGKDNSEFFIRGVTTFNEYARGPLILIDNVELSTDDLARLQPDDIASFSILKDATATALYGARGANGVVLVTTKEGKEGPAKLNIRFENSFSMPSKMVETVDPVTYMKLHNEAVMTRNPLAPRPYSDKKIEATERGDNPYVYPAVNWYDEMFKDYTTNQRVNLNVSGGGKVARYYVAGTFNNDTGLLKNASQNNFDNNISLKTIQLRSNTNINITKTTQLNARINVTFEDYKGPIDSGDDLYKKVMAANPVLFPMTFPDDSSLGVVNGIKFGNYGDGDWLNPYADMVRGYKNSSEMILVAQLELKENLRYITEGLSLRVMGSTTRASYFDVNRFYKPSYYSVASYNPETDKYVLNYLNPESAQEFLDYNEGKKEISTNFYLEASLDYNRTFGGKHDVSGMLVYTMRNELLANQGSLIKSLAYRNMGLSGRFTYSYANRYFVEANFGYNGSERFAKNERFGFFPTIGAGWILSNEKFWGPNLKKTVNLLKLKATYGLVGNDAIGSASDRFFYLSNVNMNASNNIYFGDNFQYHVPGVAILQYANENITWET
ncbi:MAG: SusC/RagA family TonB-linked outer membrane protein, partial [Candidatus Cryptobacteroides sp.]